jgi:hypothetical protein
VDRARFAQINFTDLSSVAPVEALAAFPLRRKMSTTGVFQPITPFSPEDLTVGS